MIIELTQDYTTIVDSIDEDLDSTSWCAHYFKNTDSYYADDGYSNRLHRLIMSRILGRGLTDDDYVDHKNGDTLDNRRENLRLVTNQQNCFNKSIAKNNTTGYKGVSRDKGKFVAGIKHDYKRTHIGYYNTAEEAALAYNKKALELFGEFAKLNEVNN